MALTKKTVVDKIEIIGPYSLINVRETTQVLEDGVMISDSYHRYVVAPGEASDDAKVAAVITAVHTPEVIKAYEQHLSEEVAEHTQTP